MEYGFLIVFAIAVAIFLAAAGYAVLYNRGNHVAPVKKQKNGTDSIMSPDTKGEQKEDISKDFVQKKTLQTTPSRTFSKRRETVLPVHREVLYETQNIDAECFYYFKGARVLLVEDNKINQGIIKSILQKSGMALEIANNGAEALEMLEHDQNGFDIILMDISMPVMDGIEATGRIRQQERFDMVPIVTFTAFVGGEEIEQMFEAGSNAFLTKPLNINQLYTVFKIYIRQEQRETKLENILQIEGLDVAEGLRFAEEDEFRYKERLEMFLHRYSNMYELMPQWIRDERYDRVRAECFQLQSILGEIGAYEMKALVDDMIKDFIYKNEHLLPRFIHIYPIVFKTLLDAIRQYLEAVKTEADQESVPATIGD